MVNRGLTKAPAVRKCRPDSGCDLSHLCAGILPWMTAATAVDEPQRHLTDVHHLALCMEGHPPRTRDPDVPDARDRVGAEASRLDRRELGLKKTNDAGFIAPGGDNDKDCVSAQRTLAEMGSANFAVRTKALRW